MPTLTQADLNGHNGVNQWYFNAQARSVLYSSGLKVVFDKGEAYWLLSALLAHETKNIGLKAACQNDEDFDFLHFWTLTVNPDKSAVLSCRKDTDQPEVVRQEIPFTDFPLPSLTIYAGNDGPGTPRKLFLPSEY